MGRRVRGDRRAGREDAGAHDARIWRYARHTLQRLWDCAFCTGLPVILWDREHFWRIACEDCRGRHVNAVRWLRPTFDEMTMIDPIWGPAPGEGLYPRISYSTSQGTATSRKPRWG